MLNNLGTVSLWLSGGIGLHQHMMLISGCACTANPLCWGLQNLMKLGHNKCLKPPVPHAA